MLATPPKRIRKRHVNKYGSWSGYRDRRGAIGIAAARYPDLYPIARDRALKHLQAEVVAEERDEDLI